MKWLFVGFGIGVILLTSMYFLPISTKQGFAEGTRGLCKNWPEERFHYSLILGQKNQFVSVVIDEYTGFDTHNFVTQCGKPEVHSLHIL